MSDGCRVRLGYFTMPVHPLGRNWHETLQEDREAIILADELGYYDAFVGEHLTDRCENITSSMMFQATLAPVTKQIKLASGTSNRSRWMRWSATASPVMGRKVSSPTSSSISATPTPAAASPS